MIVTLSPAKSLNFGNTENLQAFSDLFTVPHYTEQSSILVDEMKTYSLEDIQKLMKVSENIAGLNGERFAKWDAEYFAEALSQKEYSTAKPALFAFTGDVYKGLKTEIYTRDHLQFADTHFRILSGLYGMISPLSLIQPYRLEMGTRLSFEANNKTYKNLYEFWSDTLTQGMNALLENDNNHELLNLASVEYSKVLNRKKISGRIVDVDFLVEKNGVLKNIGIFAKQQRGRMSDWIIQNNIESIEECKSYTKDGFVFDQDRATDEKLVFVKRENYILSCKNNS